MNVSEKARMNHSIPYATPATRWPMNARTRGVMLAVGIVIVTLFAAFIWPTLYWYDRNQHGQLIRYHRVTGQSYINDGEQWQPIHPLPVGVSFEDFAKP